ncbi:HAD domain-containing protein [Streptomyces werraensis]|uniref:HAD domain-containing protein n=1 Tax=Streptomyces werraensis TaxID=68284 RepID=UPI00343BDE01
MNRPLLFLDVDGPLNPYAAQPERRPQGYLTLRVPRNAALVDEVSLSPRRRPLRGWLNPEHGRALLRLEYDLCWATTWMDEANRWIAPALGLPGLPFVDFGDALFRERPDRVHWKTAPLVEHAGGRPFAWVDDEQTEADRAYVDAHHEGPALLHHVDPRIGLRDDDLLALADFAGALDDSHGAGPRPAHQDGVTAAPSRSWHR